MVLLEDVQLHAGYFVAHFAPEAAEKMLLAVAVVAGRELSQYLVRFLNLIDATIAAAFALGAAAAGPGVSAASAFAAAVDSESCWDYSGSRCCYC